MAETVKAVPNSSPVVNQAIVLGKIIKVREWKGENTSGFATRVKLPVSDEYESSPTIEISSHRRLGREGEEIRQLVKVDGFLKRGTKESGDKFEIVNNRLTAIE